LPGSEASERAARVDALLERIEQFGDPGCRETATEAVGALVALYGEGLARIVARADPELRAELADDELVSHLMLLHDLHPVPLAERVDAALASVRPYLESHGGGVEVLAITDGVVRLRLRGSCSGCPSSTMTLKLAIEDAIRKAAPDVEAIEAEGAEDPAEPVAPQLLQIENVSAGESGGGGASDRASGAGGTNGGAGGGVSWTPVGALPQLREAGTLLKRVAGQPLLFVGVDQDRYAYRPSCPGCGQSLERAELRGAVLACAGCERTFDVRRAGRCLDAPRLHLEPVPLLVSESGIASVAVSEALVA
jgi:Fe-S cluster biogenesis protein NfuA/nitrite reductase/ring-hydroxylating ferredoxin subunit